LDRFEGEKESFDPEALTQSNTEDSLEGKGDDDVNPERAQGSNSSTIQGNYSSVHVS